MNFIFLTFILGVIPNWIQFAVQQVASFIISVIYSNHHVISIEGLVYFC